MMLKPEQRTTLTISESGVVLTEAYDGNEVPSDYSFSIVNDYVHAHGRHFEELQYLALGMANHIDAQQARIAEMEQDAARYRWLRDKMLGVDFDWNESGLTALSFEMPEGCAYGGNCDQNIDAAMQKDKTT